MKKKRHDEYYRHAPGSAWRLSDLLTDVLRSGAQALLAHAVEAEVAGAATLGA